MLLQVLLTLFAGLLQAALLCGAVDVLSGYTQLMCCCSLCTQEYIHEVDQPTQSHQMSSVHYWTARLQT